MGKRVDWAWGSQEEKSWGTGWIVAMQAFEVTTLTYRYDGFR